MSHRDGLLSSCLLHLLNLAFPVRSLRLMCRGQTRNEWRSALRGSTVRDCSSRPCTLKHLHSEKVTGHLHSTGPVLQCIRRRGRLRAMANNRTSRSRKCKMWWRHWCAFHLDRTYLNVHISAAFSLVSLHCALLKDDPRCKFNHW